LWVGGRPPPGVFSIFENFDTLFVAPRRRPPPLPYTIRCSATPRTGSAIVSE
jgi:hypothetical protein